MRRADFSYQLPVELIADRPLPRRGASRLLGLDGATGALVDLRFADLGSLLRPGDLLVLNDTRVLPARLVLRRGTGGAVEVLLLEPMSADARTWSALVRPSRKLRDGEIVASDDGALRVVIGARLDDDGVRAIELDTDDDVLAALARHGRAPLPPYITEPLADPERYQTVYATRPASSAAPTAGLHLTPAVLDALETLGIGVARVELVVGLDTFKPVTVDDPADHRMHTEAYRVAPEVLERCAATKAAGGRVVAVGTTSVRALESAAVRGPSGRTDLFIRRPYDFRVVDVLLTNFHLPRTTLLVMIDAFVGPRWRSLYETALANGYRFLSFGDAMLLTRARSSS